MKNIFRIIANILFGIRRFNDRKISEFAKSIHNKKVLELGSGKKLNDKEYYSAKKYFDASNEFIQTDINPEFGHLVVDVTTMNFDSEYDVILCLNVLEHVFDYPTAIENLYAALKQDGILVVLVPAMYPLHDEPHDYWRFTEHSLRRLFSSFQILRLDHSGIREFPVAYFLTIRK